MYNLPGDNLDRPCPDCHRIMVDLSRYGDTEDIGGGLDSSDLSGYGYGYGQSAGEIFFLFAIFGAIFESIGAAFRRARLRRICRRVLPEYPRSLICPSCLFLARRR